MDIDDLVDSEGQPVSRAERAVTVAIDAIFQKIGVASHDQLVESLDAAERELAGEVAGDPIAELEMRRRIAESRLIVATRYRQPLALCESLLDRIAALGWSNLEVKAGVLGVFCKYCLDTGARAAGLHHLLPLEAELAAEHASKGEPWVANHLDAARRLRAKLEAR